MSAKIPLLDLHKQFETAEREIREAVERVFKSQQFILGPEVEALEREIAALAGCPHGIGVSSGSDALLASLMALGIGNGDEVVTSPYTFFASAGAVARTGAKPVFADIDPETFNIDPAALEKAITKKTKAVVPVHLFGQTAEMTPIMEICRKQGVAVIEDAAQALGAEYHGQRAGSFGTIGCFSFFPSKNLGAMGDAGMIVTRDAALAEKLRVLRSHGSKPKYFHAHIGGNFRIDALQAAILRAKFKYLDGWTDGRVNNAGRYDALFTEAGLRGSVSTPKRRNGDRHIFHQYVIRAKKRDGLKAFLAEQGIQTEIYYPLPMHLQECFKSLGYKKGDFPESERAAEESLALPIYPELTAADQTRVVKTIRTFYKN